MAVASNWTLVWWRFRRHRLALVSAVVLILMYVVVLVPDFFSTQNPETTDARQAFVPIQGLHLFDDGRLDPWVPAIVGKRDPVTLRMNWVVDPAKKIRVRFFAPGHSWRVLGLGIRPRAISWGVLLQEAQNIQSLAPFRAEIQMIFQDPFGSLNPRMALLDNVGEPLLVGGMRSRSERAD